MKYFLDMNVLLDALLERAPFEEAAAELWAAVESRLVEGFVAAHAVTTIFYLIRKARGNAGARHAISRMMSQFKVAAVDTLVVEKALSLNWTDFEDAVSAVAAERAGCDLIVTRDPKHFRKSVLAVHTPESAMFLLSKH